MVLEKKRSGNSLYKWDLIRKTLRKEGKAMIFLNYLNL